MFIKKQGFNRSVWIVIAIVIIAILAGVWYESFGKVGADIVKTGYVATNLSAGKDISLDGRGTIAVACNKTIPSNIVVETSGTNYTITNSSSKTNVGKITVMESGSAVEYLKPGESKALNGLNGWVTLRFDRDENKCGLVFQGRGRVAINVVSGGVSIASKGFTNTSYVLPPYPSKTTGLLGGMNFGLNLFIEDQTDDTLNVTLECKKARHSYLGGPADIYINGTNTITPYVKSNIVYYPFHNISNTPSKTGSNTNYDGSTGITGTSPWVPYRVVDPILADDTCTTTVTKIPTLNLNSLGLKVVEGGNSTIQFSSSYYFKDGEKFDYKPFDNLSFKGLTGEILLWINTEDKNYNGAGLHKQRGLKVVIPKNFTKYDVYIGNEMNNLTNTGLKGTIENYRYIKIVAKEPLDLTAENMSTFRFKTDSTQLKELKFSISGSRE